MPWSPWQYIVYPKSLSLYHSYSLIPLFLNWSWLIDWLFFIFYFLFFNTICHSHSSLMPLALTHLWSWQCASGSNYGLSNHFNLGYSQFLYRKVLLPTFIPNVTLRFFTPPCSFHILRLWLILVSSYVHKCFSSGVSHLYVFQSLDSL